MSGIDSSSLIEGAISAGSFVSINYLLGKRLLRQRDLLIKGVQQGVLTVASPIARKAIVDAGFSLPLSEDIADSLLTGAGFAVTEKFKRKSFNPKDILVSVGSAYLARKGMDVVTGKSLLTSPPVAKSKFIS